MTIFQEVLLMRWLLSFGVIAVSLSAAAAADLKVGFGEADITPDPKKKPVYLAGFGENRKATGIHDPLMARAVVLSDGTTKIALVSVDVVGLFLPVTESIRAQLPGFQYVLVSSTHNHEGPDTLGLWGPNPFTSGIDPDYIKQLEAGAVSAVKAADKALAPATARVGTAAAPELLSDGRLPVVKHDTIGVIAFDHTATKKPLGMLVQWNNHPEDIGSKNTLITGDFPPVVINHLKSKYGCPVAYFTGTVGGLMTSLNLDVKDDKGQLLPNGSFERLERYGKQVGARCDEAIAKAQPATLTPFVVKHQPFLLPMDNELYRLAWMAGTLKRPMYKYAGNPTPEKLEETKDVKQSIAAKTEVSCLTLGDVQIAVIPGEIYPELVLGKVQDPVDPGADFPNAPIEPSIYGQLKAKHKLIIGLGNDELGYFIPKRQWDEKAPFCYGLKKSQYGEVNSMGPECAPIICGTFEKMMKAK